MCHVSLRKPGCRHFQVGVGQGFVMRWRHISPFCSTILRQAVAPLRPEGAHSHSLFLSLSPCWTQKPRKKLFFKWISLWPCQYCHVYRQASFASLSLGRNGHISRIMPVLVTPGLIQTQTTQSLGCS